MSVLINGMEMPKDCPMCIAAHYNKLDEFTGCEIVSGKKYAAQRDAEYAKSSTRPDWCPLVPVPPHGDLIDRDPFIEFIKTHWDSYDQWFVEQLEARPTIIEAEEGE